MNKILSSFLVCLLATMNVYASDVGEVLDRKDVSRLELLANNLNIMFMMSKYQEEKNKKSDTKGKGTQHTLTKYSVSKDHRLIINKFYSAPVAKVTKKECNTLLSELSTEVTDGESSLTKVMQLVSAYDLSARAANNIAQTAYLNVYIQANENKQLSLRCSS